MRIKKVIGILLLAFCIVLSFRMQAIFATESSESAQEPTVVVYGDFAVQVYKGSAEFSDNTLTLQTGGQYTVAMKPGVTQANDHITLEGSADKGTTYLTIKDLNISAISYSILIPDDYTGNVEIIISGTNKLYPGIEKSSNSTTANVGRLSIHDKGDNTATLTVTGEAFKAAIGGKNSQDGVNIYINANVTATGGSGAAGIGGGSQGAGNVTINGGTVIATGGEYAAGIGGGYQGAGNVTIYGGTVTAIGGSVDSGSGAGIGGGWGGAGNVTINGGTVTAIGGSAAASIGGGDKGAGNVTINGGTVTDSSSDNRRVIGSGHPGPSASVTITGGSINSSVQNPKNKAGVGLKQYTLTLYDALGMTPLASTIVNSLPEYPDYNLFDVQTDSDGKLYVWLPEDVNIKTVQLPDDTVYKSEGGVGGSITASNFYYSPVKPLITVNLIGAPAGARGVVFPFGSEPYNEERFVVSVTAGVRYVFMIDRSTASGFPSINPLIDGYELVGLYINDNYPKDGNHVISSDFTQGWVSWGTDLGGTTYRFTAPDENLNITAVIAYNGIAAPLITTETLLDAQVGVPYSHVLGALGYNSELNWNVTGQPGGLTFNKENLTLSGTPTKAGVYTIKVEVQNAKDDKSTTTKELTLTVRDTLSTPTNLRWDGTVARWDAVAGANYYHLRVFRDGEVLSVSAEEQENDWIAVNGTSYDIFSLMRSYGVGSYTFNVTAMTTLDYLENSSISEESASYEHKGEVANPVFSQQTGTYYSLQDITITCATEGASIYYTTDGTFPSASNGTLYSGAIRISTKTTLSAIAIMNNYEDSSLSQATYTITLMPLPVSGSLFWDSDIPSKACWLKVDNAIGYSTQLYRADTEQGQMQPVGHPVTITSGMLTEYDFADILFREGIGYYTFTVKALGNNFDCIDGDLSEPSAKYYFEKKIATPTFSPGAGDYREAQEVTITCNIPGASIYYILSNEEVTPSPTNGTLYTGPIRVSSIITIFAIAVADGMTDSDVARAHYAFIATPPDKTPLLAPGGLAWDSEIPGKARWNAVDNTSGYKVQLYCGDVPVGESVTVRGGFEQGTAPTEYDYTEIIAQNGAGVYTFRVQALSGVMTYSDSEWSAPSPEYVVVQIISVNISWGAMVFTYNVSGKEIWSPEEHAYIEDIEASWSANGNTITVTNHSNVGVGVTLAYASAPDFELTGKFDLNFFTLPSAVGMDYDDSRLVKTSTLTITGVLPEDTTELTTIGTITVTLSAVIPVG